MGVRVFVCVAACSCCDCVVRACGSLCLYSSVFVAVVLGCELVSVRGRCDRKTMNAKLPFKSTHAAACVALHDTAT